VTIILDASDYRCLLDNLSNTSPAYKTLEAARHIESHTPATTPDQYVVDCTEEDAKTLLAAATKSCSGAANSIRIGLAGRSP